MSDSYAACGTNLASADPLPTEEPRKQRAAGRGLACRALAGLGYCLAGASTGFAMLMAGVVAPAGTPSLSHAW